MRHHSPPELDRTSPVLVICAGSGSDAIGALKEGHHVYAVDYSETMHRSINSRLNTFVQLESERFSLAFQASAMGQEDLLNSVSQQAAEDTQRSEQELAFKQHVLTFLEGGRDDHFEDPVYCDVLKLYVKYALEPSHLQPLHTANNRIKVIRMLCDTCGKTFAGAWNHFLDNLPPESDVKRKIEALQLTKVDDDTRLLDLQQEVLQVAEAAGFEPGATNDWQPPKVTPRKAPR